MDALEPRLAVYVRVVVAGQVERPEGREALARQLDAAPEERVERLAHAAA